MSSDKGECYDGFEKASGKNGLAGRKKDKGRMCKKRAMEYHKNKNCGDRRNHCVISTSSSNNIPCASKKFPVNSYKLAIVKHSFLCYTNYIS